MKKIIYYARIVLFIIYLLALFILIDKIFTIKTLGSIYFIVNLIYSFIVILSILSKKKVFINSISYNILSIAIYLYTVVLCYITYTSSKLTILNNISYYQNNFILLITLFLGLIVYTIELNKEE